MARGVQISSGGVYDIGLHVVWCAKVASAGAVSAATVQRYPVRAALAQGTRPVRRAYKFRIYPTCGHRRIRNRRADFHHKTARALVQTCDVIALEDLRIRKMTRSASGTPGAPGTNVAAKSGLNRSILDAGWDQFADILAGKAEEAGRRIVFVDPRNTSITCHQCGQRCLRPCQAPVICPVHGGMDADVNGAKNIYTRAGLGSGQAATAA